MKKSELILKLAERADITASASKDVVDIVFEAIASALERGDRVEIRGFGSFATKNCMAYLGMNPHSGEKVQVPPKRKVVWKSGKDLYERINSTDLGWVETN